MKLSETAMALINQDTQKAAAPTHVWEETPLILTFMFDADGVPQIDSAQDIRAMMKQESEGATLVEMIASQRLEERCYPDSVMYYADDFEFPPQSMHELSEAITLLKAKAAAVEKAEAEAAAKAKAEAAAKAKETDGEKV